ncbi:MAG: LysM peptidoglycan-binding domain-containing protein [Anaerolineae bacterium]|nr:LysM peptidoglycan-binding domain-containing protein [Anaerolineae bacterium]
MLKKFLFTVSLAGLILLIFAQSYHTLAAPLAQLTVFPTPTPGPDGKIIYIAQENDTVWRIAAISGITVDEFRKLNPLLINDIIIPGESYLIGYAGPSGPTAIPGVLPTQAPVTPSPTAPPGWGILCVLLYNDVNGDSMRQETEPSIQGGEISISNRLGSVSLTAETPSGGIATNIQNPTPQERGYTCFDQLLQGEYLISVAAPEGYNRTTELNQTLRLEAGQTTEIAFGAQANSETEAQTAIIPETPGKSPLLGILGGLFLLAGIGLGVYAALLRRAGGTKTG